MFCKYYQAQTKKDTMWFVIGSLKGESNMAFERTIDKQNSIIELFVPECQEDHFLYFMNYLKQNGYVTKFQEFENRLKFQGVEDKPEVKI